MKLFEKVLTKSAIAMPLGSYRVTIETLTPKKEILVNMTVDIQIYSKRIRKPRLRPRIKFI